MPDREPVQFSAVLRPSAKMEQALRVERPGVDGKPELARAGGAALMLRVMQMPIEERVALLTDQANDPVLVLFAMLAPNERRQVIQAAEDFLKAKVTE